MRRPAGAVAARVVTAAVFMVMSAGDADAQGNGGARGDVRADTVRAETRAEAARARDGVATSPSRDWLIASAVLALPPALRDGAEVRGWTGPDSLVVLRPGTNDVICLADDPTEEGFAAACYAASLEPFMARGRQLRREGVDGARRNEVRWREYEAGTLPMPAAAMVYNLTFANTDFDPATTDPATGGRLHSLYIPGATTASTGVTDRPGAEPWLMLAGTPSAHIMITLPRVAPGPP